jgi:hypothetical protein
MRPLRVRLGSMVALALISVLGVPQAALAAPPVGADLEGRPLSIDRISGYYCHDLDYPRIHCFTTAAELESAVSGGTLAQPRTDGIVEAGSESLAILAAAPAGTWVTVYKDSGWTGSYAYLSRNYSNLSEIGWNDRISSYRVQVGFGGEFWQHSLATGWLFPWTPFQTKSYVGDAYNDQFSSFYRL